MERRAVEHHLVVGVEESCEGERRGCTQLNWCSPDQTCGGFTYKGFTTNDHTQKFKTFFFHLLLNYEDGPEVWNWVTYKAERDHIVFLNKTDPGAHLLLAGKQLPL